MRTTIIVIISVVGLFVVLIGTLMVWWIRVLPIAEKFEALDVAQPLPVVLQADSPQPEAVELQRPDWVDAPPHSDGDCYRMSVAVGPYTTRAECDAQLPAALQEALDRFVDVCLAGEPHGPVVLPYDYLLRFVKDRWEEVRQHSVGPMTTLHVLVEFDRKAKDRVLDEYRRARLSGRLRRAALFWLGWLVLLAGTYGYLKTQKD